jgi:hypothetical protein
MAGSKPPLAARTAGIVTQLEEEFRKQESEKLLM